MNLGLQRREPLQARAALLLQSLSRRRPLAEPVPRGDLLGLGPLQDSFSFRQSRLRLFVRLAAPGEQCDLPFDPGLDYGGIFWSAVAERSTDPLLAGGHAGLQLGAARLQLGEALPGGLEPRQLSRERSLVLPGERFGFLSFLPCALERGPGRFELGCRMGGRWRVHELLAHRAGLAGNQPLAEVIGLVQTDRAMHTLLGRLEAA